MYCTVPVVQTVVTTICVVQYVVVVLSVRRNGALGSRLTGAGWGGCVVSLVPADRVHSFVSSVGVGYYTEPMPAAAIEECLFASEPGDGAALYLF